MIFSGKQELFDYKKERLIHVRECSCRFITDPCLEELHPCCRSAATSEARDVRHTSIQTTSDPKHRSKVEHHSSPLKPLHVVADSVQQAGVATLVCYQACIEDLSNIGSNAIDWMHLRIPAKLVEAAV